MKDIPGFEGLYAVTEDGRVWSYPCERSSKYGKFLKPIAQSGGYKGVSLCKNNSPIVARIHRLVALTYIPNPKKLPCIDHVDHNRLNNLVYNLRWVTHLQNNFNHAKTPKGVRERKNGKYSAYVNFNRRQIYLGVFSSFEEAEKTSLKMRDKIKNGLFT